MILKVIIDFALLIQIKSFLLKHLFKFLVSTQKKEIIQIIEYLTNYEFFSKYLC